MSADSSIANRRPSSSLRLNIPTAYLYHIWSTIHQCHLVAHILGYCKNLARFISSFSIWMSFFIYFSFPKYSVIIPLLVEQKIMFNDCDILFTSLSSFPLIHSNDIVIGVSSFQNVFAILILFI